MEENLILILKTVERCNLNCKYCYFFNGGDESYKKHPPFISKSTIGDLIQFLKQGVEDLLLKHILVVFHGGEPLLQPIKQFEEICLMLLKELSPVVQLSFKVQTNATLISDEWIDIFSKYNVSVGISIDGPKEYNDVDRVDHKNRGSYDSVRQGIELLQQAVLSKKIEVVAAVASTSRK